jgi:hypothetical protein
LYDANVDCSTCPTCSGDIFASTKPETGLNKPGGVKHDHGKPDLSLLDRTALEETAIVLSFGATKYGRDNWRNGLKKSSVLAAALRHIFASLDGETLDKESGRSHLAHAACEIMFGLHYELKEK